MMKTKIKYLPFEILGRAYELLRFKKFAKNFLPEDFHLRVLCYHDVPNGDVGSFEKQIKFLKEEYNIIDADQLRDFYLGRGFLPGQNIFITFDDSSIDHYENVAPILEKYGVKGCFFVVTGDIERGDFVASRPGSKLKPMTWEQVIDLDKRGHIIGSHTESHSRLSELHPVDIKTELVSSKKLLEEKLKKSVDFFAFPYGTDEDVSHEVISLVEDIYDFSFLLLSGKNYFSKPDRYLIKRTGVNPRLSIYHLRALMTGIKDFMYTKRISGLRFK